MSRAALRTDRRGTMELPFKLITMIILISASVSVGMVSYRNIQRSAFERQFLNEMDRIVMLSRMITQEGNLSSQDIRIDLSGSIFAGMDQVRFGDSVGGRTELITYRMNWRNHREFILLEDGLHFTSPKNDEFILRSGIHDIRLTCMHVSDDTTVVIVSLMGQRIDHASFYS